jgi:hypothetical protein
MATTEHKISDSDETNSPPFMEKGHDVEERHKDLAEIPDPDAGLSEEERKALVSIIPRERPRSDIFRTANFYGSSISNSSHGYACSI